MEETQVQKAIRLSMSRNVRAQEDDEEIGDLQIAEYVVFLLALDTYMRYVEEATNADPQDEVTMKGVRLLRISDAMISEGLHKALDASLPTDIHKKMLARAMAIRAINPENAGRRALMLRTILSRGGPSTQRAVFQTNRALKEIREAMAASMIDDADSALDKFAAISMRNTRLKNWIDLAARTAVQREIPKNDVNAGSKEAVDQANVLLNQQVQSAGAKGAEDIEVAQTTQSDVLSQVEQDATNAARKALETSGEPDRPPTRAETVGIAVAAATAAISDPSKPQNVPDPLRKLDDEQRAAALTDGRVLVAAGAGSGKCVRGDTLVRTAKGFIPIQEFGEDLAPDQSADFREIVLGLSGPEETSTIYHNGTRSTIILTTRMGYRLEGTRNHPVLVLREGRIDWVCLGEVREDDNVCIDRRPGFFPEVPFRSNHVPMRMLTSAKASGVPEELTPQVAALLGYIISEGHTVYGEHSVCSLTTTDSEQLVLYQKAVEGVIQKWTVFERPGTNGTIYELRFYRRSNLEALADFGLTYVLAHKKEIPGGILRSPKNVVVSFLRSLFDGDGWFSQSTLGYGSASEELSRQVHLLLLSFGIVSSLRFKPNDKKGSWDISITGDNARRFLREVGFNLQSKQKSAEAYFCVDKISNTNLDVVPGLSKLLYDLHAKARDLGQKPTLHPKYHTFKCYANGTRNPSQKMLLEILEAYPTDCEERQALQEFAKSPWYYDTVDELKSSEAEVFDFVVPGTHSFSAAGFVNHNSTTLVARVEYLVKERRVFPSRILVTSFNTKAANELKQKIGSATSGDTLQQMSVGTMHSLFRKFIGEYGTPQERSAMGLGQDRGGFIQGGGAVARAVQRIWAECFPPDSPQERKVPKLKNVLMAKSKWSGNNVTPAQALADNPDDDAALWYEMYEGLKGSIPGWKPPCGTSKGFEAFMGRWRPNNQRLGDFDDMLIIFRDILKREPMVRKTLQGMFDHILVDECQDLNQCQNDIIEMMSEHIKDATEGKSVWMVGDDRQSIYGFRGARPDIFIARAQKENWVVRTIRTNYRCQPEIVDAANKLIAHNEDQIPMEAVPSPAKVRGTGSIRVLSPTDEAEAALDVVEEIKATIAVGGDVADNAILTRTNKEQHAFETACIIRGVPYARKGTASFLGSPETKAFLSYVQLATGDDFSKMQAALGEVINKPNRFFITPDAGVTAVQDAISAYARRYGQDIKVVNPLVALGDPYFQSVLAEKLTKQRAGFKFDKAIEKLEEIGAGISEMQANSANPEFKTKDLFDSILGMTGIVAVTDPVTGRAQFVEQTFRDSLKADLRDSVSDDDDSEDEDDTEGLGNVSFLYELAKRDPTDPGDLLADPNTPTGFKAKMERYAARARELRIDITKWDKEQAALPPEQRKAPPGVFLGTVHSTKGAQWKTVYVSMPKGKFPFEPPQKPGMPPPLPETRKEELESERRLGYVALTRAAVGLTIVCPKVVGGKAAGISPFVGEAELRPGENVPKPGATPPLEGSPEIQGEVTKTADYEDVVPDEWSAN